MDYLKGELLLVDKPLDWTSFDVCNKIRGVLRHALSVKKIKVGHSGTLDPRATGLLLIATGKMTKSLHELQGLEKTYTGRIKLGATTASYDAELPEENIQPIDHVTEDDIRREMKKFVGDIMQVPPLYSAVKKDGKKAYAVARSKGTIQLDPRPITVYDFHMVKYENPFVEFHCHCSKGTYIRSLAHDLGEELGVGGYLSDLRRTSIGEFRVENALSISEIVDQIRHLASKPT